MQNNKKNIMDVLFLMFMIISAIILFTLFLVAVPLFISVITGFKFITSIVFSIFIMIIVFAIVYKNI